MLKVTVALMARGERGGDSVVKWKYANAKRSIVWLVGILLDRFPYLYGRLYLFTFLLEGANARLEV